MNCREEWEQLASRLGVGGQPAERMEKKKSKEFEESKGLFILHSKIEADRNRIKSGSFEYKK